jgi:site-specific DNA-cytosine methylase
MGQGGEMSLGSLFAGIGGFDFAAHMAGIKIAWQIEKDQYSMALR